MFVHAVSFVSFKKDRQKNTSSHGLCASLILQHAHLNQGPGVFHPVAALKLLVQEVLVENVTIFLALTEYVVVFAISNFIIEYFALSYFCTFP